MRDLTVVLEGVRAAQAVLSAYIEPGPRDAEATIENLLGILGDEKFLKSLAVMRRREKLSPVQDLVNLNIEVQDCPDGKSGH
jgi:hypothetical protein